VNIMKKNKVLKIIGVPLLVASFFLIPMNKPAEAFGPTPVWNIDPTVDLATINNQINTAKQLLNQLTQLENEAKNLAQLDPNSLGQLNTQISTTLQQMQQVNAQMQAIGNDYTKTQQEWDSNFNGFGDFNGMSASGYAQYMGKVQKIYDDKIKQAMASQGLASDAVLANDVNTLNKLLSNSQNAQGAVAATQAGSQIAALQIQELMRMQKIMSDSYGAQAVYYKKKIESEKATEAAIAEQMTDKFTPTQNGGFIPASETDKGE
jgi:P-type conjugative transfer protein TrbJ